MIGNYRTSISLGRKASRLLSTFFHRCWTLSTTSLSHNDTLKTLILCLIIYSYAAFFMGNIFNSIMPKIIAITHPHCENGNYKNHHILVLGFLLLETFYSRFHFSMGALKPQKLCPLNCLLWNRVFTLVFLCDYLSTMENDDEPINMPPRSSEWLHS